MRTGLRRSHGFTLIGALFMVALLGVVATASVTLGALMQRRWAEEELLARGADIARALLLYQQATPAGQQRNAPTLEALLRDPRFPGVRRYLREIPIDPMTGLADWQWMLGPEGGIVGVRSAATATPLKIAEFEAPWQHFAGSTRYADWSFCNSPCIEVRIQQ